MITKSTKLKSILIKISLVVFAIFLLVLIFLSPIVKYTVEKYDKTYLGREVLMDLPYINPFTGYIHLRNLKVYENESDSLFFYTKSVSVNIEMLQLLKKKFKTTKFALNGPHIQLLRKEGKFNFDDIIQRFSKDTTKIESVAKKNTEWNISGIEITNGLVNYEENRIPVKYFIKGLNVKTKTIGSSFDTLKTVFDFQSGPSFGTFKGVFNLNLKTIDYFTQLDIKQFDLSFFEYYVKDIANFASLSGVLNSKVEAFGNFKNAQDVTIKGFIGVEECHLGKNKTEDYASFKSFNLNIEKISPKNKIYKIDSISLYTPYFKYETYDNLDNIQMMFGKAGEKAKKQNGNKDKVNILFVIGEYVKKLSANFFKSDFQVKKIGIYNGILVYNDYSLKEKFHIKASPINLTVDSIERKEKWIDLKLTSGINSYGTVKCKLIINPLDSSDFKIDYHVKNVPVSIFNPYVFSYTSYPMDRGTIEVHGNWNVNNGLINSTNNLVIIDPRIGQKNKINGAKWLPLKVGMFFVRERGNVIDYEIPIKGNLNDPKFKFKDVVLDIITNIFVKPATTAYRYNVKNVETEIEKSLSISWELKENKLMDDSKIFLEKVALHLKENKDYKIVLTSMPHEEKEKEYIMMFQAKKRFLKHKGIIGGDVMSEDDSTLVDELSIKDSTFCKYIKDRVQDPLVFTVHERCEILLGASNINAMYKKLLHDRHKSVRSYFKIVGVSNQVKFATATSHKIPYDGFSIYKLEYEGDVPADLIEAFQDINSLNMHSPRDKYSAKRKRIQRSEKGF